MLTWTTIGAGHTDDRHPEIEAEIAALDWQTTDGPTLDAPACPGLAINTAIRELRIPKVSAVAWNGIVDNRYGLYGIEGNYANGRARVYVLDLGSTITPLASELLA